jgi:Fe-S cluster assembly protein SufD
LANYTKVHQSDFDTLRTKDAPYLGAVHDPIHRIYLYASEDVQILQGTYDAVVLIVAEHATVFVHDFLIAQARELVLLPGAHCTYLHHSKSGSSALLQTMVHAGRDSILHATYVGIDTMHHEHELVINLHEPGSLVHVQALYSLSGTHTFNLRTMQHHRAPHTTSRLEVRKMLKDSVICGYHGMIRIDECAAQSDASQQDRTLLLSSMARAESVPAIEVLTHDVQCAHGSALGTFDQEMLWYLSTRGIAIAKAESMMQQAFFAESIDTIPNVFLRDYVVHLFNRVNDL